MSDPNKKDDFHLIGIDFDHLEDFSGSIRKVDSPKDIPIIEEIASSHNQIQKILQLSKKEFEEISTTTPNYIINKINPKGYNKKNTFAYKKNNVVTNISKCKSNKNNISISRNKGYKQHKQLLEKNFTLVTIQLPSDSQVVSVDEVE